jgi:hypothetical protein
MSRPDPFAEIRMTTLHATRGANFWSSRPITRMDLAVGAYDDINSADVEGFTERLVGAMPGLWEHRCSVGERGGFVRRLRRGTYAPHVAEHVALELQGMIGHDVGYGRTRGGDVEGEYTLVFEHLHEGVGLRCAALALQVVQRAFAGTLESVRHETAELRAIAATPDVPPVRQWVRCGITGGAHRNEARDLLCARLGSCDRDLVVDVSPSYVLQAGLPYSSSDAAIVLDARPVDVPPRYREAERAQRLVAVVADAVGRRGMVIVPAKEWEVQEMARDAGCTVGIFSDGDDITRRDEKVACATAWAGEGRIYVDRGEGPADAGRLDDALPAGPQVAAALAAHVLGGEGPAAIGAADGGAVEHGAVETDATGAARR